MAARDIIQMGDPVLWRTSAKIADASSPDTQALIGDLDDTLAAFRASHGYGRGIAAPQIGILKRAVFVRLPSGKFTGALINPRLIWTSDSRTELWDSCFSFPDLLVKVSRADKVRVAYIDHLGEERVIDVDGDAAELFQHEIDHLDGILAVERAVSPQAFATRAQWERMGKPKH